MNQSSFGVLSVWRRAWEGNVSDLPWPPTTETLLLSRIKPQVTESTSSSEQRIYFSYVLWLISNWLFKNQIVEVVVVESVPRRDPRNFHRCGLQWHSRTLRRHHSLQYIHFYSQILHFPLFRRPHWVIESSQNLLDCLLYWQLNILLSQI